MPGLIPISSHKTPASAGTGGTLDTSSKTTYRINSSGLSATIRHRTSDEAGDIDLRIQSRRRLPKMRPLVRAIRDGVRASERCVKAYPLDERGDVALSISEAEPEALPLDDDLLILTTTASSLVYGADLVVLSVAHRGKGHMTAVAAQVIHAIDSVVGEESSME